MILFSYLTETDKTMNDIKNGWKKGFSLNLYYSDNPNNMEDN